MSIIQAYRDGVAGVRSANPEVRLRVGRDATLVGETILFVDYPGPTDDPAARDVWCDAESTDWTAGSTISFQAKAAAPIKLSVSFLDRNRVAYTAWIDLQGDGWQQVLVPLGEIRPNPYFQPPDAKTGLPMDVSDIKGIAFAPHDHGPGHLAMSTIVLLD